MLSLCGSLFLLSSMFAVGLGRGPSMKKTGDITSFCTKTSGVYTVILQPGCGTLFTHCNGHEVHAVRQCGGNEILSADKDYTCKVSSDCAKHEQPRAKGTLCASLPDGLYAPYKCSSIYTICYGHTGYTYRCRDGQTWEPKHGACVPLSEADCSDGDIVFELCVAKRLQGVHPVAECARGIVDCRNQEFYFCPEGKVFSGNLEGCVDPEVIPCDPSSKCTGTSIRRLPHATSCEQRYQLCIANRFVTVQCPPGHAYQGTCIPVHQIPSCVPIATPRPVVPSLPDCTQLKEGARGPHPGKCRYYYQCIHSRPMARPCAPGTAFDTTVGEEGTCVAVADMSEQARSKCKM